MTVTRDGQAVPAHRDPTPYHYLVSLEAAAAMGAAFLCRPGRAIA